jgi:hypothetical protein
MVESVMKKSKAGEGDVESSRAILGRGVLRMALEVVMFDPRCKGSEGKSHGLCGEQCLTQRQALE